MANLVTPARALGQLSALAVLLCGASSLYGTEASAKLLAAPAGPVCKAVAAAKPGPAGKPFSADAPWCQINGDRVNVRTGPGMQHQVLTMLHGGDYVKGRAVKNGWLEIDWPQNLPAWIGKEFVKTIAGAGGAEGAITTRSTRVYSAGQVRSTAVAKLESGAHVAITGEEGNWYKIKAPESAAAYVSVKYLISGVSPPSTPRTDQPVAAAAPMPPPADPAPQPVSVATPALDSASQTRESLLAAIEETRKELKASRPGMVMPTAVEAEPAETFRASEGGKAEIEELESVRVAAEKKIAARAEEQARRESEEKRLQEIETARKAEAAAKAEIEERAKRQAEEKRLQEIETARKAEAAAKAELEERAKRETEVKRLQEIETAHRTEAAAKADLEEQAALQAAEPLRPPPEPGPQMPGNPARDGAFVDPAQPASASPLAIEPAAALAAQKAENAQKVEAAAQPTLEEQVARIAAEEQVAARQEEHAKRIAEMEEQAARQAKEQLSRPPESSLQLPGSSARDGAFVDPVAPVSAGPQAVKAEPLVALPSPADRFGPLAATPEARHAPALEAPRAAPVPATPPVQVPPAADSAAGPLDQDEAALLATLPQTLNRINSKFVAPTSAPAPVKTGAGAASRAEVLKNNTENAAAAPPAEATAPSVDPVDAGPVRPAQVQKITAPRPAAEPLAPELPKPAGAPPAALRLKPVFETQVRAAESSANVITAEGLVVRRSPSPVAGVEYALVLSGQTLHFLVARADVNLEGLVGRRVSMTGVPLPGTASEAPVLEVRTATITE